VSGFVPDPAWPTIVELAIEVWGQPNRLLSSRTELRFGANGSKSLKPAEMVWRDHEAGTGGGYVPLWHLARGAATPLPPRSGGAAHVPHPAPAVAPTGAKPNGAGQPLPDSPRAAPAGARGIPLAQDEAPARLPPWQNIGKRYPYLDAAGHLVLEVIRTLTGNPRFAQRRPDGVLHDGETKWRWSVRDIPRDARPLYRLPGLVNSAPATVFITEGEKDADNVSALGLIATTCIGGSGKWRTAYNGYFAGRDVVVLPDNDPQAHHPDGQPKWHLDGRPVLPGQDHADAVARALVGVAATVRVLMLPGLPPKGDVTDWIEAGGTRVDLEQLARDTPLYVPPVAPPPVPPVNGGGDDGGPPDIPPPGDNDPGGPGDEPPLPVITCQAGELPRMVREAEDALLAAGAPVYQRAILVRPAEQEYPAADGSVTHSAALVQITPPAMLKLLSRVADWQKWDGRAKALVTCDPPLKVIEILLASRGEWRFPVVRGVLTCPTIRPDGSLLTTPGYDPASRYYLMFPTGLALPAIPDHPTRLDAEAALTRLEALLAGYPFVDDAGVSFVVALCLLMTQVLRCGMAVSPLLAVSATAPGSGKSHLVDLASTIAVGRPCPIMGAGKNDEETEKGINTHLLSGVAGFSIDNVHRSIDLALLNIATERPMIGIRLFGTLDRIEVENATTIYTTGNNLPIVDEQVRRTLLCRLDAGVEQPEQRAFGDDPIATVLADRGRYIADILIIARAYLLAAEKPDGVKPFGSYAGWSRLVREPLMWLGHPDPVASQDASRASDPEVGRLRAVITAWAAAFGLEPHTLADAARYALTPPVMDHAGGPDHAENLAAYQAHRAKQEALRDVLREAWGRGGNEIDTGRWGYWMRKFAGRIVDGMMFRKGETSHSAVQWTVVKSRGFP
jgi:putative DNA primase/helicase